MPIPFACPHCGARTNVADEYAGQSGPCASCGKTITVPRVAGAPPIVPARSGASTAVIVIVVVIAVGFVALVGCGILAGLLLPAVNSAREAARRASCMSNLQQIGMAMMMYESEHKCFPPAYLPDKNGRPMHSWRVLLLPYLEHQDVCAQYRFGEPWDSPHNRALADKMPPVYRCPSDPAAGGHTTHYQVIVGPKTMFPGATGRRMAEVADGLSQTILVVEASGPGVNWMEPRDLDAATMSDLIDEPQQPGIGSPHPAGANVLFADGHVVFLRSGTDPQTVKALVTADGKEAVKMDDL